MAHLLLLRRALMDELLADFRAGVDIYLSVHRDASDAEVAVKQVLYEYTR